MPPSPRRSRKNGWVRLRLVNASPRSYTGFRLGVNSIVQLTPRDETPASLERRIGSYHELVAPAGFVLEPGAVWDLGPLDLEYQLVHANDGPFRAFLVDGDGTVHNVQVAPVEKLPTVKVGDQAPRVARARPAERHHRRGVDVGRGVRAPSVSRRLAGARHERRAGDASIDDRLGPEGFSIDSENGTHTVAGGSRVALQWALMELAKRRRGDDGARRQRRSPHGTACVVSSSTCRGTSTRPSTSPRSSMLPRGAGSTSCSCT